MSRSLFKSTIVIWSKSDPTDRCELSELAREAESGEAYCSSLSAQRIENPSEDPDWDGTDFFDSGNSDSQAADTQQPPR